MKAPVNVPRLPSRRQLRVAAARAFARRNRAVVEAVREPMPDEVPLSVAEVRLLRGLMRAGELLS